MELTREQVEQIVGEAREKRERPDLRGVDLRGVDLRGVDLRGVDLREAVLRSANLRETNLTEANLYKADFTGANLYKANLFRADLYEANLSWTNFRETDLSEARLSWTNLFWTDFIEANLTGAKLNGANLTGANLTGANLTGANLSSADLTQTNLDNTNFSNAIIGDTSFIKVDLSRAKGLMEIQHKRPSIIDINTIYQSKDKIPKEFLEKAGVHPDIIRWQHSLHTLPTVFICYSHKDEREKELLLTHLSVLKELGKIDIWDDSRITGGADWEQEIIQAIARSTIAILLVSANFLTSKIINTVEIPQFLERYSKDEEFIIYPVIIKHCLWNEVPWLNRIEVRPKGGKPIWSGKPKVDAELSKIAGEVIDIIKDRWLR